MASKLQMLIRRSQPTRIVAALHSSPSSNPSVPLIFGQPHHIEVNPEPQLITNLSSFLVGHKKGEFRPSPFRQIYPSFRLNPISIYGSVSSEAEDLVQDDSGKVWADSVKKKRKRKMNKHKYKKLRKRLRRQT
ncbi:hypothetical protein FNV43_RR14228 [Rhamnella rubrinervis]|uniref:Ribosomal protein mS38 C-terminal domain-containing protein n=1 Tax=Rhamnella rubrinervis TaxID=2594499 RepID=A0A8K0H2I2_9ROSA|nr:hypothetical protein FNV43_RR14228 [Rhamnella rubrinervis]